MRGGHTWHINSTHDGLGMKKFVLNCLSFMGCHISGGGNVQPSKPLNSIGSLMLLLPSRMVSGASE